MLLFTTLLILVPSLCWLYGKIYRKKQRETDLYRHTVMGFSVYLCSPSLCSTKGRYLLLSAEKETTRLRTEESGASTWSNKTFLFFFLAPIKNNGVRRWCENKLLRDSFSWARKWICAFVSKVFMYSKPKDTLKPKCPFWNPAIPQGFMFFTQYLLFFACSHPSFTPKWISAQISIASIWIITVGCGK